MSVACECLISRQKAPFRFRGATVQAPPDPRPATSRCTGQRFHIFSIDSDVCFYPEEQAQLAEQLKRAGVDSTRITVHSEKGHDSFLLEPVLFEPYIRAFLA